MPGQLAFPLFDDPAGLLIAVPGKSEAFPYQAGKVLEPFAVLMKTLFVESRPLVKHHDACFTRQFFKQGRDRTSLDG